MSVNPAHVHAPWDRIAHMNRAKDRKPAAGGRVYTVKAKRRPAPAKGSIERTVGLMIHGWRADCGGVIEDYMRAAFPERYEGFVY